MAIAKTTDSMASMVDVPREMIVKAGRPDGDGIKKERWVRVDIVVRVIVRKAGGIENRMAVVTSNGRLERELDGRVDINSSNRGFGGKKGRRTTMAVYRPINEANGGKTEG